MDERQSELDNKDAMVATINERNEEIVSLKLDLEAEVGEKRALEERLENMLKEKYEFAERTGSPPGQIFLF